MGISLSPTNPFPSLRSLWTLLVLGLVVLATSSLSDKDAWWLVEKGPQAAYHLLDSSHLYLRHSPGLDLSGVHSCYEFRATPLDREDVTIEKGTFCYPSVIITGVRKAGTSALYSLLSKYSGAVTTAVKENCPYIRDRSILDFFRSFPSQLEYGKVLIDGCADVSGNLHMRKVLRGPRTFYLVTTRDFSPWVWSAYVFCSIVLPLFSCLWCLCLSLTQLLLLACIP
jgi:hypothetical protein